MGIAMRMVATLGEGELWAAADSQFGTLSILYSTLNVLSNPCSHMQRRSHVLPLPGLKARWNLLYAAILPCFPALTNKAACSPEAPLSARSRCNGKASDNAPCVLGHAPFWLFGGMPLQ